MYAPARITFPHFLCEKIVSPPQVTRGSATGFVMGLDLSDVSEGTVDNKPPLTTRRDRQHISIVGVGVKDLTQKPDGRSIKKWGREVYASRPRQPCWTRTRNALRAKYSAQDKFPQARPHSVAKLFGECFVVVRSEAPAQHNTHRIRRLSCWQLRHAVARKGS